MPPPDLAQALQIGRRSNQLPDVHSIAGLEAAPAALVSEGWFRPIGDLVDVEGSPVGAHLYDGIHRFDGKIYTFPVFTGRRHDAIPWTNTALLKTAGVDPATSPATWDDFRRTARTLTDKTPDDVFGLVVPGKEAAYLDALVNRLAMAASAPGGVDWRTGEYVYGSQPYVDAFEFLLSLKSDKVIHPASPSMGQRDARARWAAGQAVVYPWGPWFIGGLKVEEPGAVDRGLGVWHVPTPETTRNLVYSSPAGGPFWVSNTSKNAKTAADLMLQLATEGVQTKLASTMDVPPVLLDLVRGSKAHPTYQQNVAFMEEDVRIGPAANLDAARARAGTRCGSGCSSHRRSCCTASTRSTRSSPATGSRSWSGTGSRRPRPGWAARDQRRQRQAVQSGRGGDVWQCLLCWASCRAWKPPRSTTSGSRTGWPGRHST
jgi:multiple sugar transport system substrate-binding protein